MSRHFHAPLQNFVRISGHVNPFTGAIVHFDELVEIHEDDVDWLTRMWDEGARLDFELWRAGAS